MNEHEKYKSLAHSKTRLRYHIIFSTKYRRKCLDQIRNSVLSAFKEAESNSDFRILVMELDKDHIHLLLEFKPNLSISQVVRRLKQLTTWYIWRNNKAWLEKFYWIGKRILWSGGYFCSTIGDVSEKTIKHYIENQG